jgi:hypothetical protein
VKHEGFEEAEAVGAGDADGVFAGPLAEAEAAAERGGVGRLFGAATFGEGLDELSGFGGGEVEAVLEGGEIGLDFAESFDPADGELYLFLNDLLAVVFESDAFSADGESDAVGRSDAGEGGTHGGVEIDVGSAAAVEIGFEGFGLHVRTSVDATAGTEALEAKHLVVAGDDGVGEAPEVGHEEAGVDDVGNAQELVCGFAWIGDAAAEKVWIGLCAAGGGEAEREAARLRLGIGIERVTICVC